MTIAEYIWIDGQSPVGRIRSKTRKLYNPIIDIKDVPSWGFDGSSTGQADGNSSDCVLKPVKVAHDPLRGGASLLVLCEAYRADGKCAKNNFRKVANILYNSCKDEKPIFGLEQEYTLFDGHAPLGWPRGGYAPQQGPFYCGVGADEAFGAQIAEKHMLACLEAGLAWCGKNGEVMCGQWEFQVGARDPLTVSDDLWLARYLLYKIAEKHNVSVKLDPKPHPDLNGAGMHTNFSTINMREENKNDASSCNSWSYILKACMDLGYDITDVKNIEPGVTVDTEKMFPPAYGTKYNLRLTGEHETCSWKEFKYGVSDRTASIRIPLHVEQKRTGYIEDRRPCADADPYRVVSYIMKVCCDV